MGRRTLLLIASILVAALGTTLVWLYVQGADTRAQQDTALVKVLFLAQDAPAGTDAGKLTVEQRDVLAAYAPTAVTSQQELVGKVLTVQALTGQVLLKSMVGPVTQDAARFPKGGAVAITIAEANRVPADLLPGDHVDVYVLGAKGETPDLKVPNITVRTIGLQRQAGTAAVSPVTAVSAGVIGFDATPDQARTLYEIVGSGQQVALYDTGTGPKR